MKTECIDTPAASSGGSVKSELLQSDQDVVVAVIREMRARRKRPPISAEDFLSQLERQGLKKFVAGLRSISAEI